MKVWIEEQKVKRKWWFGYRRVYFVCTRFMRWEQPNKNTAIEMQGSLLRYLWKLPDEA